MAMSILLKFLTLKWNISRTIGHIEVSDGSSFCIFQALSFELNFFDWRFPLRQVLSGTIINILISDGNFSLGKNDEVNCLETPAIKNHKTNSLETPAIKSHSNTIWGLTHTPTISHEDEKTALVFFLAGGLIIWNIFR